MTNLTPNFLDSVLKTDLAAFTNKVLNTTDPGIEYLHNWHIDLIAHRLERVTSGKIKRLIINMPPRSLKSTCISVAWPAWLLGQNPTTRIMAASYSSVLSTKHSLDTRLVLQSDWYRQLFPETAITEDQNEKTKFVTTQRGFRFATSVGGTATGEGGDFLVVDDPHNPAQAASSVQRAHAINWFDQTFASRLNNKKKGAIVVVMQRLHVDDLTGHLLKKGGWEHLCLPAIFEDKKTYQYCASNIVGEKTSLIYSRKVLNHGDYLHEAREGKEEIDRARNELGSFAFSAQYQQNPVPLKGGMVEASWFKRYGTAPEAGMVVQSWDTAIKAGEDNDYSVCTTWKETSSGYYLLDVTFGRFEYPALKRTCISLAEKWQPGAVLIEDKASGQSLLQDLRQGAKIPAVAIKTHTDKITRFASVTPLFESGNIYLPERATWLPEFEAELLAFPNAAHDDLVDSTSQYLNWAKSRKGTGPRVRGV